MKRHLFFIVLVCLTLNSIPMGNVNPGCIRQNSNEIRRGLLFMHIADGHFELLHGLLDCETIFFTDQSGKTVIDRLNEFAQKGQVDVSATLKHIENLNKPVNSVDKT